ncbi:hypothetical protein chiPu_0023516, partial [Chiloscyllium punctatum]|nr:hypothetical protein [Chiloscyllium punctatum]
MPILSILFSGEERGLIREAMLKVLEREHPVGDGQAREGEAKFPLRDPGWHHQNEDHRENMKEFKDLVIKGIREVVPKSQNLVKAFDVCQ